MPLEWLGTLESRPSPLAQALQAVQPSLQQVAQWLAQRPERERQMLQAFEDFISSLPSQEAVEQVLQRIPPERAAALVELSQKHGGRFFMTAEGKLSFAPSVETLQQQQTWRVQRAQELLAPVLGAPDEQKQAWIESPEGQQTLREVQRIYPQLVLQRGGRLEPIENVDVILERQSKRATIEKTEAEAGESRARAAVLTKQVEQIDAEIERMKELLPEEKEQLRAQTRHLNAQAAELEARHSFIAPLMQAQLDETRQSIAESQARVDDIRSTIEQRAVQTQRLTYELDELKRTAPLRYQQLQAEVGLLQEQLQEAVTRNKWLEPVLRAQYDQLVIAVQSDAEDLNQKKAEGPIRLRTMQVQLDTLIQQLDEMKQTFPDRLEQLRVTVENARKEGKSIDAQTLVHLANVELIKAQTEDIPASRALQWYIAENNVDIETARLLADIYRTDIEDQNADADRELQRFIAQNKAEIDRINADLQAQQTHAYVLQVLGQYAPEALVEALSRDKSISDETKQKILDRIRVETSATAIARATDFVQALLASGQFGAYFGDLTPLDVVQILAVGMGADIDFDSMLKALQDKKELKDIVDQSTGSDTGADVLGTAASAVAAGVIAKMFLKTGLGQTLRQRISEAAARAVGGAAAAGAAGQATLPGMESFAAQAGASAGSAAGAAARAAATPGFQTVLPIPGSGAQATLPGMSPGSFGVQTTFPGMETAGISSARPVVPPRGQGILPGMENLPPPGTQSRLPGMGVRDTLRTYGPLTLALAASIPAIRNLLAINEQIQQGLQAFGQWLAQGGGQGANRP